MVTCGGSMCATVGDASPSTSRYPTAPVIFVSAGSDGTWLPLSTLAIAPWEVPAAAASARCDSPVTSRTVRSR